MSLFVRPKLFSSLVLMDRSYLTTFGLMLEEVVKAS